ncbi:MAG: gamma-glutamyl-gamma-aminobutyrate hydrolase family protein [Proteobacteria bacterium]|nr:gamma-glutamyl-gamma-aminobutyrate hydrolase family protein [Pseudomonadota bacterium]
MKPLIGITFYEEVENNLSYWQQRTSYFQAVVDAGGLPISLPPLQSIESSYELFQLCSGIIIPGGVDVDPNLYHEEKIPQCGKVDPKLDSLELRLVKWCLEERKPLLGICRGIQILNVALGGSLYQDLPTQFPTAHFHKQYLQEGSKRVHDLEVKTNSKLFKILNAGNLIPVNSTHHQAIKTLGRGLIAVGHSTDGLIEAVEMEQQDSFVMGIQAHPELLTSEEYPWKKLFLEFVRICVNNPVSAVG